MQLRYLGDSHDYIKFALLRHMQQALDLRIGVNWYLTDAENNGDGEQRRYLDKPEWERLDKALLEKLRPFLLPEYRTLENFERGGILPKETLYYKCKVSSKDRRSSWHQQALTALSQAQLVFLDQDNGFEVPSMTDRTQAKYAFYEEAFDYYEQGKIVVGIQFARQCDPVVRGRQVRENLIQSSGSSADFPIVRGRVSPNILFLLVSPSDRAKKVGEALETFAAKSPVLKGSRCVSGIVFRQGRLAVCRAGIRTGARRQ
jgi:hypothetical protein